ITDISERKQAQERLAYQAFHDDITRLPNRTALMDRLEHAIVRARRAKTRTAVLFLDLDGFKAVNDRFGHEMGDQLLLAVAQRLQMTMRLEDTIGRLGGDEFTIIAENLSDAADAIRVAQRALNTLRHPFMVEGREIFISASIGIVVSESGEETAADMLREADLAMYQAKDGGRARWQMFDHGTARQVIERLEIENDLRAAVDRREILVHYQPQVALSNGRVSMMEALARWSHPRRGLLWPDQFIPLAEGIGVIEPLDRFVLREACAEALRWTGAVDVSVSVNISPRVLLETGAVDDIVRAIEGTGLTPTLVQLEVTERLALQEEDEATRVLRALKSHGIRIAVDDFGTGYSSLGYLTRLPVDSVKLDRAFIGSLATDPKSRVVVESVIRLAHALGMKVTAEGVESRAQAVTLVELGCDNAQGFYFGEPRAAAELDGSFTTSTLLTGTA
ncbi:MAG: EAL domain-containing protein, partial [Actinobacteria bacterium]|nr:EAL domain-containing protein [Actinomycetota bacterium]